MRRVETLGLCALLALLFVLPTAGVVAELTPWGHLAAWACYTLEAP